MKKVKILLVGIILILIMIFIPEAGAMEEEIQHSSNDVKINGNSNELLNSIDGEYYTITYILNGGTYRIDENTEYENTYTEIYTIGSIPETLPSSYMTRISHNFLGWFYESGMPWVPLPIIDDIILYASWEFDPSYSYLVNDNNKSNDINKYFYNIVDNVSSVDLIRERTTADVYGRVVSNVDGTDDDIQEVREVLKKDNYGGCGPLAMIGIFNYFTSGLGHYDMFADLYDIAYQVYHNTTTYGIEIDGEKNIFTLPNDYVNSFNYIASSNNYGDKMYAYDQGLIDSDLSVISYNDKINLIKQSILKGLPVTIYTTMAGEGDLKYHYFNVYGFEEYEVTDEEGKVYNYTLLLIRRNFGDEEICYANSELLRIATVGVIAYEIIEYDYAKSITSSDFFNYFINDSNTGLQNYVTDSIPVTINNSEGYFFDVKRTRVALYDNRIILSANNNSAINGVANLYLYFDKNIKKIYFDLSAYSSGEIFTSNSIFELKVYEESSTEWRSVFYINAEELGAQFKRFCVYLSEPVNTLCFQITCPNPETNLNYGRVVIDNIKIFYNAEDQHYHSYSCTYNTVNHTMSCLCGDTYTETHTFRTSLVMGKLQKSCIVCGYIVDMNNDFVVASIEEKNKLFDD